MVVHLIVICSVFLMLGVKLNGQVGIASPAFNYPETFGASRQTSTSANTNSRLEWYITSSADYQNSENITGIELYDLSGKSPSTTHGLNFSEQISPEGLTDGIYFVKPIASNKTEHFKFVTI